MLCIYGLPSDSKQIESSVVTWNSKDSRFGCLGNTQVPSLLLAEFFFVLEVKRLKYPNSRA